MPPCRRRNTAALRHALVAAVTLLLGAAKLPLATAQWGGADPPPDVAARWSALDTSKWSFAQLQSAVPLLRVPAGFAIDLYYKGGLINNARSLALSGRSRHPGGPIIVYASTKLAGRVWALVDQDADGTADRLVEIARGLDTPQGLDWYKGDLFVSGWQGPQGVIWRIKGVDDYALAGKSIKVPPPDVVTRQLPKDRWHGERYMRFGPDGLLYVSIGAPCDVCPTTKSPEGLEFSTIYTLNVSRGDGGWSLFARGLRNVIGMDWHPDRRQDLYFTENGRDNMGDNQPDCELNRAEKRGLFFGFPLCHTTGTGDPYLRPPGRGGVLPDPGLNPSGSVLDCNSSAKYRRALQALGPHIAPLGVRFYQWELGRSWPREYDRALIIAEHGSADRSTKIGYRLVAIWLSRPTPKAPATVINHRELVSGWLGGRQGAPRRLQPSWGRPADVLQLPDGSLLISDDAGHTIYRLRYVGAAARGG